MDSKGKTQSFALLLPEVLFLLCLSLRFAAPQQFQQFESFTQKVAFYPASLMISHSSKPLTFYDYTKLLNMYTGLNFTEPCIRFTMSNHSCSAFDSEFFSQLLDSVRSFQKVLRRLLSLPGFLP